MIIWTAAEKAIEYDNEEMRIAKLQLGCNAEIHSLSKRAQEIKTELLQIHSVWVFQSPSKASTVRGSIADLRLRLCPAICALHQIGS
jgi:hypothetical protein